MKPPSLQIEAPRMHGFTLIEVLIAAVLFAFAASALVGVVVNTLTALQSQERISTENVDQAFVWDQLRRIDNRDSLEEGGRIPLLDDRFVEWEAEHEPTEIADLHQIRFTLTRDTPEGTQTEEWSIYRLAPWLSEPSERAILLNDKRRELEARR